MISRFSLRRSFSIDFSHIVRCRLCSAIGAPDVDVLFMDVLAQQQGALMVVLEHRFYGKSQPFADLSTPNLRYLTSQHAVADMANFIAFMRKTYPTVNAVVTIGGMGACHHAAGVQEFIVSHFPHVRLVSLKARIRERSVRGCA